MSKNIYVVSGCLGFVGFNLANQIHEQGHKVIGIDLKGTENGIKKWRCEQLMNIDIKILEADISDKYDVRNAWAEVNKIGDVESVFHLAGLAGVRRSLEVPSDYYNVNLRGTFNLLQIAKDSKVRSFIFSSTSSVYGDLKDKKSSNETDKTTPISPYAYSKLAAEEICKFFSNTYSINISILRYFTVYGPSGRPDMSILKFIHKIFNEEPITIYGDGSQKRDFTYITDICEGTFSSSSLDGFNILNLGRSDPVNLMKVVELIQDIVGKPANIEFKPNHPLDVDRTFADISNAKRLIQWTPKVSIQSGLKKTYDWYINNIDSIDTLE